MKLLVLLALLFPVTLSAQTRIEKSNTIYGTALLIDTAWVRTFISYAPDLKSSAIRLNLGRDTFVPALTSAVIPAFSITRYTVDVNDQHPAVITVKYYGLDDCAEIPFNRIFHFKQQ